MFKFYIVDYVAFKIKKTMKKLFVSFIIYFFGTEIGYRESGTINR